MDIPVDDRDPLTAPVTGPLRSQRRVVEKTVTVCLGRLGMVAGRPNEGKGDLGVTVEDGVNRDQRRAGRCGCRLPASGRDDRAQVGFEPSFPGTQDLRDLGDVVGVVHRAEFGFGGMTSFAPGEKFGERPAFQNRTHIAYSVGVLGMKLWYFEQWTCWGLPETTARVVVQDVVVPDHLHRFNLPSRS